MGVGKEGILRKIVIADRGREHRIGRYKKKRRNTDKSVEVHCEQGKSNIIIY